MGTRAPAARLVYGRAPAVARPTTTWTASAADRLRRTARGVGGPVRNQIWASSIWSVRLRPATRTKDHEEDRAAAGEQGDGHDERRRASNVDGAIAAATAVTTKSAVPAHDARRSPAGARPVIATPARWRARSCGQAVVGEVLLGPPAGGVAHGPAQPGVVEEAGQGGGDRHRVLGPADHEAGLARGPPPRAIRRWRRRRRRRRRPPPRGTRSRTPPAPARPSGSGTAWRRRRRRPRRAGMSASGTKPEQPDGRAGGRRPAARAVPGRGRRRPGPR